jgi:hypothetical protein
LRLKQLLIKTLIVVFGTGAAITAFGTPLVLWFQRDREQAISLADSHDGRFRALVIEAKRNDGRLIGSYVLIERKFWIFSGGSYSPFWMDDTANHVDLKWTREREVTIYCHECDRWKYQMFSPRWGSVIFRYDLSLNPRPKPMTELLLRQPRFQRNQTFADVNREIQLLPERLERILSGFISGMHLCSDCLNFRFEVFIPQFQLRAQRFIPQLHFSLQAVRSEVHFRA